MVMIHLMCVLFLIPRWCHFFPPFSTLLCLLGARHSPPHHRAFAPATDSNYCLKGDNWAWFLQLSRLGCVRLMCAAASTHRECESPSIIIMQKSNREGPGREKHSNIKEARFSLLEGSLLFMIAPWGMVCQKWRVGGRERAQGLPNGFPHRLKH